MLSARSRARAAALLVTGLIAACGRTEEPSASAADPPVARVSGETLHLSDVRRAVAAHDPALGDRPLDPLSEPYRVALQEVVDQRLLAIQAQRLKLDADPAVRRRLAAARDKVLADAELDREVAGEVSEPAVRVLYDEQRRATPAAPEVRLAQVVSASRSDAAQVRAQLAAGGDIAAVAQRRSTDAATRFAGGELGWVAPAALGPAYASALAGVAPGGLAGPVQTPAGWVVARVEERRTQPPLPYDAARPQLVRFLTYARLQALLARLRREGDVVILPPGPPPSNPGARP